jgi:signal transduction histidine kinase
VAIPPDLPTVLADRTYVEQVVRNLLSNAAKYAGPEADVALTAELRGGEVEVRVLDDGPGFGADEAARLFELYYRSPGTAATTGGAGIGLFVCARLVHAMGGRIWAAARPEGGAEFGFSLQTLGDDL